MEARARLVLAELEKRAGLAAGAPDPRVARAVEEAKGRKQVAGKRRSSSATATLPELDGIREFTLPASRAKSPELVDATDHVHDIEDEAVEQDGDQDEEFDWDEFTGTAAPSTFNRASTPAAPGADGDQGFGGDEEMSIFDRMEALVSVSTGRW